MNKEDIIKYLESNELDVQSATAAHWTCDLVYTAYVNAEKAIKNNLDVLFCFVFLKHLHTAYQKASHYQITAKKALAGMEDVIYNNFLKNRKSIAEIMEKHRSLEYKLDEAWAEYQRMKAEISKTQELRLYKKFVKLSRDWWHYGLIGENKGDIITVRIIPEFAKRHNMEFPKAQGIFNLLSHPKELSVLVNERKRFLELCLDYSRSGQNKNLEKKINKYIKDYFWVKTDIYKATVITPNSVLQSVKKEAEKGEIKLKEDFSDIDKNFENIEKQKADIEKNIKLSKRDEYDIYFSQQIIKWIDERKEGMMKDFYYMSVFVEDLAERRGKTYNDLAVYLVDDLEYLIKNNKYLQKDIADKRSNGVFFCFKRGKKMDIFYGDYAKKVFEIATQVKTDEIKGQVASTGGAKTITGKAKIIYNPAKEKFEHGEILIASMTRVEFVPLMRKAKAIITNEGGIACHAAIVSRELGIPCIIGTKNATRVLKDGDEVELDMETGTVKILK